MIAGISEISELQTLNLKFAICEKLSDNSVYALGATLNNLTKLVNLSINFFGNKIITNEAMAELHVSIGSLPKLKSYNVLIWQ